MDKGLIISDFRQAKYKARQIKIMAQLYNCSQEEIIKVLQNAGEKIPPKREFVAWKRVNYAEVERLYKLGMSAGEISRTMEIGNSTVFDWRKRNGLAANIQGKEATNGQSNSNGVHAAQREH